VPATVEEVHHQPHCHPHDEADPGGSRQVEREVEGDEDGQNWDGSRAERNGLKTINGDFDRLDRTTWTTLRAVLDSTSALAS